MKNLKNLEGREAGINALIIGAGATIKEYEIQIEKFIRKTEPFTIGINNITSLFIPNYHLYTNTQRFREYGKNINSKSMILLGQNISLKVIPDIIGDRDYTVINYTDREGLPISYNNGKITGWFRTAGCLSILIAHIMGAKEINIVGMDGYTLYKKNELELGIHSHHCYGKGHTDTADFETGIKKDTQINDALISLRNYGINFNILTPTKYGEFYDSSRLHI
jgi:hypothetical protein